MKKQDKILRFLNDRKCLSVRCLEAEAEIPTSTIAQAKTGNRNIPEEAIEKIEVALKRYGYK